LRDGIHMALHFSAETCFRRANEEKQLLDLACFE
jgi:hypothetical protein